MSSDIIYSDATKLAELIRTKAVSPVEVVQAHVDRIEAVDPKINTIVTVAGDALEAAKSAEAAVLRGDDLGPLHGVPFTAKDSIDTAGVLTQRGSPIFKGRVSVRTSDAWWTRSDVREGAASRKAETLEAE
jgi:aspartyl-tRNA(Asn)/glutamyl-tRNA(Gln) amidotransferase subunit A